MLLWQKKVFPEQGAKTKEHTVNKMDKGKDVDIINNGKIAFSMFMVRLCIMICTWVYFEKVQI